MALVYEYRACTILYNLLLSSADGRPWLLPANGCPVLPLTLLLAGRPFELVDIDEDDLCMDREETLRRLGEASTPYGAVLFVRTYGLARSFESFFAEARRRSPETLVVDDRCLCAPPPGLVDPGSSADVVLFSTGYAKPLDIDFGAVGFVREGVDYRRHPRAFEPEALKRLETGYKGALADRRPYVHADSNWLRTEPPAVGLDAYRAEVDRARPPAEELRRRINAIYRDGIPAEARLGDEFHDWRFQIVVPDKPRLLDSLFDAGLFAGAHYASLAGVFDAGRAPVTERLHDRVVNLFNDRYYSVEQAERTVRVVARHLERHG